MSRVVRELLNENTHCTTSLTATVKPLITALNTPSLCPCGAGWPMSSSQRSKRQLQANGSANRLAADGSSTARFGSGLVSLGGAPKVRLRFHGHTARHCTPLTAALPHEHLHRVKQQPVNSQHPPPSTCHRYERCVCSTPPVCNKLRTGTRWQRSTSRRPRLEQQDRATPALSTNSHWASGGRKPEGQHGDARVSNAEYPSLAAAALNPSNGTPRVVDRYSGQSLSWEDDERGGPSRPPYVVVV